jgi:hypothetical protein
MAKVTSFTQPLQPATLQPATLQPATLQPARVSYAAYLNKIESRVMATGPKSLFLSHWHLRPVTLIGGSASPVMN